MKRNVTATRPPTSDLVRELFPQEQTTIGV